MLEAQNADGSWHYAIDGVRDFVDHFHTCFVMKALAKIHALTGHERCLEALTKGVAYYVENLFDEDGLPKPFATAPRMTVYRRELYDCAECINLCLLLRDRFPQLDGDARSGSWKKSLHELGEAGRLVPLPQALLGMGQRPDAPLGAVADVPQPRVLRRR